MVPRYEYTSWNAFYRLCGRLYERITKSGFHPDTIIAIARGGYAPARILADFYGVMNLISLKIEHYHGPDKMPRAVVRYPLGADISGQKLLLVDDVSDSGDTFDVALKHIAECGTPADLRTAVLHHKTTSRFEPDYFAQRIVKWRWITYPWAVVEDMTVLALRLQPPPRNIDELWQRLYTTHGIDLPKGVKAEIGNAVLRNLAAQTKPESSGSTGVQDFL